jgi:hypothetical protein
MATALPAITLVSSNREEGGSNTTTLRLKVLRQSLNGEEFQGLAFTKGVMGRLTDDRYFESMK